MEKRKYLMFGTNVFRHHKIDNEEELRDLIQTIDCIKEVYKDKNIKLEIVGSIILIDKIERLKNET